MADIPAPVLYIVGYICLLAAALLVVSGLLSRLTREERDAERARRQRGRQPVVPSEKDPV